MQIKSQIIKLSLVTAVLLAAQQFGSQLMASCGSCAAPQNPIYTCIPGAGCSFTSQTPAAQVCIGNCVSITQCVVYNFPGSSSLYINGICGADGTSCSGAVLGYTSPPNTVLSSATSGASCLN